MNCGYTFLVEVKQIMYLTIQNQLTLLHDLLDEQMTLKNVSHYEYRQIKRLVQAIILHKEMDRELLTVLPEIYYYSLQGEKSVAVDEHVEAYERKIKKWLTLINETKRHIS